mgnify:CR=1 FL=1|jgi:hypothetical protein
MRHPCHARIVAEALQLSQRFAAVAEIDERLARLAYEHNQGDAQLAATWLALPLEELSERTPVEAWAAGDRELVAAALRES